MSPPVVIGAKKMAQSGTLAGGSSLTPANGTKKMTVGELSLLVLSVAMAFLSIFIAAKAYTAAYAFHMYVFAAASVASAPK